MTDSRVRLYKTITWTLIAFSITTIVGYLLTGSLIKGGAIGVICRSIKVPFYWLHDHAWDWLKSRKRLRIRVARLPD